MAERDPLRVLGRLRPARVNLEYQLRGDDWNERVVLPFVIGVLADFSGRPANQAPLAERRFIEVTPDNFDVVLKGFRPRLLFVIPDVLADDPDRELDITLEFENFDDFKPERLAEQIPVLRQLVEHRGHLSDLRARVSENKALDDAIQAALSDEDSLSALSREVTAAAAAEAGHPDDLPRLDEIAEHGRWGAEEAALDGARTTLRAFLGSVLNGSVIYATDTISMLNEGMAQTDVAISAVLNPIMGHESFKALESTWRGLRYLLSQVETGPHLKVKILDASAEELKDDVGSTADIGETALFRMVYETEYGSRGGEPFGVLLGDYAFGPSSEDIELLTCVARVAERSHAPFVAAASPRMFALDDFTRIEAPRTIEEVMEAAEYEHWRAFRNESASRYVALTVPGVLLRQPYGDDTARVEAFRFQESVTYRNHGGFLWGSAAWSLVSVIGQAVARSNWAADITGAEGGGLVENLPVNLQRADEGDQVSTGPTESKVSDRRARELAAAGFVPLLQRAASHDAVFQTVPTAFGFEPTPMRQAPHLDLRHVLVSSMFARCLTFLAHARTTATTTPEHLKTELHTWLTGYVADDEPSEAQPLVGASVRISDSTESSGAPRAEVSVTPGLRLVRPTAHLFLVDLPLLG